MESSVAAQPQLLGERLRGLRRSRGLTLRDLGLRTGFSVSFLSKVERGESSLTLSSLARIASALEVPVERVFAAPEVETVVSRQVERRPFRLDFSPVTYYRLGADGNGSPIDSVLVELPPRTTTGSEPFRHPGQEFVYVLSGRLAIQLDDKEIVLGSGDAIQYSSDVLHNYSNPGSETLRAIWVTTQHLFGGHR